MLVGFFGAVAKVAEREALRKAVEDSVPPAFSKLNLQAFDKGFEYGENLLAKIGETEAVVTLEA